MKKLTAGQLFADAIQMLGWSSAYISTPILKHLRTGPLPAFRIPVQPFRRPAAHKRKQELRGKPGGNFRQAQGKRYKNPALMAAHRKSPEGNNV